MNRKFTIYSLKKGQESPPGSPWPMPMHINSSSANILYLNKRNFKIISDLSTCDIIEENIKLYTNILFPPRIYDQSKHDVINTTHQILTTLYIKIEKKAKCPAYPSDMDESCTLINVVFIILVLILIKTYMPPLWN